MTVTVLSAHYGLSLPLHWGTFPLDVISCRDPLGSHTNRLVESYVNRAPDRLRSQILGSSLDPTPCILVVHWEYFNPIYLQKRIK